jgi:hypothetical protein
MYPPTSLLVALGRLGIVLLVGLSYPLQLLPCRACIYSFTSGIVKGKKTPPMFSSRDDSSITAHNDDEDGEASDEEGPLMPKRYVYGTAIGVGEMRNSKFVGFTTGILVAGFLIALAVDELEVGKPILPEVGTKAHRSVLSFVGSTGSTIISFILPGFFYFKLFRQEKGPVKWCALALGVYGVAVMVFW